MSHPRASRALLLLAAVAASSPISAAAAGPAILKVEPPSWWPGHSINPVRLLVRGTGLVGARVVETGAGLQAGPAEVNAGGTYLFLDVTIDPKATPGERRLRVRTAAGSAEIPFELMAPLPRAGRFQGFSPDDVIYLVMPDRFANGDPGNDDPAAARGLLDRSKARYYHGGDLRGITARLPYLRDLGVTALWLNPWYDNVNHLNERERYDDQAITDYHGYGAVDFYGVDEHLGDLAALRELVEEAHAHGMKVIQDQVANHTGPYHPWVEDSPTPTWYNGTAASHLANVWQTWTLHDPHGTAEMRRGTLDGWFIDILPDLNQDDPEVARYIIQNTLWWVGVSGLDGIRQDTLPYVPRRFWREWMAAIKREYPDLRVVGELFDADPVLVSFFEGGVERYDGIDSGIDTLFDFPLFTKVREAFGRGSSLREAAMVLARDHLYRDPGSLVTFLGLHDVGRFRSEPAASTAAVKAAFTFLLTARGTPLVYYGDEIGLPGGGDPDNRRDFPGGFPEDPRSAFEATGRTPEEEAVFSHVRRLLQLRRGTASLRRGGMVNLHVADRTWVYARLLDGRATLVALNNEDGAAAIDTPAAAAGLPDGLVLEDRLGSGIRASVEVGRLRLTLPGRSSAVFVTP